MRGVGGGGGELPRRQIRRAVERSERGIEIHPRRQKELVHRIRGVEEYMEHELIDRCTPCAPHRVDPARRCTRGAEVFDELIDRVDPKPLAMELEHCILGLWI